MAHVGLVRLPVKPMVTSDGRIQAQTTRRLRTFSGYYQARRQVTRGSKRRLPSREFGDPIHESL